MIGHEAEKLSQHSAVWHRLREARNRARDADDVVLLAYAREDVTVLSGALAECLGMHEPRDGSPYCPACSAHGGRVPWPCRVWQRAEIALRALP